MTPHLGRSPRRFGWRWYVAVVLATVAQLAVNLLPVVDGWHGLGAGPHIEAVGATAHYAHVEETCVACHVHAIDAHAVATARLAVSYALVSTILVRGGAYAPVAAPAFPHRSRAPPTAV